MLRAIADQENGFCENRLTRASGVQAFQGLQDQLRNFEFSLAQGLFETLGNGLGKRRLARGHGTASFGRSCVQATASSQWKVKPKLFATSWRRPIFVSI
ncbi:hypothetical protein [Mesorhizobium sp.]|uniref:hypothetical protein n=1 Tax=Mesorhizobium sp. TaxID=1871066 RepID=UPI00257D8AA4|nr:hypothetical protein [Mesorhizobium sp.]